MRSLSISALAVCVALVGCGGDDDDTSTTEPTPTITPTISPTPEPVETTTRLEAENAELTGEAQLYEDGAASNGGGVAFLDLEGNGFTYSNVPESQSITVHFASQNTGVISLSVNGEDQGDIVFSSTGNWVGAYADSIKSVDIPEGATVSIFHDTGDQAMNVDYVEFHNFDQIGATPHPTPTPNLNPEYNAAPIRYEAEQQTVFGGATQRQNLDASFTNSIELPATADSGVRLSPETDSRAITLGYLTAMGATLDILINGQLTADITLEPSDLFSIAEINLDIVNGDILEVVSRSDNGTVELDYIELHSLDLGAKYFEFSETIGNTETGFIDSIAYGPDESIYIGTGQFADIVVLDKEGNRSVIEMPDNIGSSIGLDFDSQGNLFFADFQGDQVVKVDTEGNISILVEDLIGPAGLGINSQDEIFVTSFTNSELYKIQQDGSLEKLITNEGLNAPIGVNVADDDIVYIGNWNDGAVLQWNETDGIRTIAQIPNGNINQLTYSQGYIYAPDSSFSTQDHKVYRIDRATSEVEAFFGTGEDDVSTGHISRTNIGLAGNIDISDDGKHLFMVAEDNNLVKFSISNEPYRYASTLAKFAGSRDGAHVDSDGSIVVGGGLPSFSRVSPTGEIADIALDSPPADTTNGFEFDADGNLYIASWGGSEVYFIDTEDNLDIFIQAPNANDVLIGQNGNVFVAACGDSSVKEYDLEGTLINSFDVTQGGGGCVAGLTQGDDGTIFASNYQRGEIYSLKDGEIATLATVTNEEDGTTALINHLAFADGYIYVPSENHNQFYRVDTQGNVEHFMGTRFSGVRDGHISDADVVAPWIVTPSNNLDALFVISNTGEVQVISSYMLP